MSLFDALSDGTLLRIRSKLPPGDLITHVSLSQTCRRLRKLYLADDAFWQRACFLAGFGRPLRLVSTASYRDTVVDDQCSPSGLGSDGRSGRGGDRDDMGDDEDEEDETLSWRSLAHVLVNHARLCEIRSCRDANAEFAEHYRRIATTHLNNNLNSSINTSARPIINPQHPLLLPGVPREGPIQLHPLYFYLHFSHLPVSSSASSAASSSLPTPSPSPTSSLPSTPSSPPEPQDPSFFFPPSLSPDVLSILLTHLPTFPESKWSQYGPLCSHPNASCAFVTFPPVRELCFDDRNGETFLEVHNPDGCTILDVNRALAALIPQELESVEAALAHYHDLIRTSGLSKKQFADRVSKERGFLGDHEYPFLKELVGLA